MIDKNAPEEILSNKLAKLCEEIENDVRKSIAEPPPEQRFISVNMLRDKAALEAREALTQMQGLVAKGLAAIISTLKEEGGEKAEQADEILEWFNDNAEYVSEFMDLKDEELGNKTLEEVLDFPRDYLNAMHKAASKLLQEQRYDEALAAIMVCIQFNSLLSPLWFTYGLILQARGDQEPAIYVFNVAAILDEGNPYIYAHMARSWIVLGEWLSAYDEIQKAKEICQQHPEYTDLIVYCKELEEWMEKYPKKVQA